MYTEEELREVVMYIGLTKKGNEICCHKDLQYIVSLPTVTYYICHKYIVIEYYNQGYHNYYRKYGRFYPVDKDGTAITMEVGPFGIANIDGYYESSSMNRGKDKETSIIELATGNTFEVRDYSCSFSDFIKKVFATIAEITKFGSIDVYQTYQKEQAIIKEREKEMHALRQKNEALEQQVIDLKKELEQLKSELSQPKE